MVMGDTVGERILCWTLAIGLLVLFIFAAATWDNGSGGARCANVDVGAHGQAVCSD